MPEDRQAVSEAWHHLCFEATPPKLVMVSINQKLVDVPAYSWEYQEFQFTSGRTVQAQFNVLDFKILGTPSILGEFPFHDHIQSLN